jgi:hypothetical protein
VPQAIYPSLFFTVVLLVTQAYFLMGGLPLLVLQHDTPLDGRFIRRFFEIYCKTAIYGAAGACLSYAAWGRPLFALGTAAIGGAAFVFWRTAVPKLERLGAQIQANDPAAIKKFRQVHTAALLTILLQLVFLVWGVTRISV